MVLVKGKLIPDPETVQDSYRHTNGKTKNVNEREDPVLEEIAAGDLKVVPDHDDCLGRE
jgi:hypothetical protein